MSPDCSAADLAAAPAPRLAIVTVAGSGLGRAFCLRIALGPPCYIVAVYVDRDGAAETLAQAEVRRRFSDLGTLVTPMNAKEFGAFIQREMAKWRDAVKAANVKIE